MSSCCHPHHHKGHFLLSPAHTCMYVTISCTVNACLCAGGLRSGDPLTATFFSCGTKAQPRWNEFLCLDLGVYVMDGPNIKQACTTERTKFSSKKFICHLIIASRFSWWKVQVTMRQMGDFSLIFCESSTSLWLEAIFSLAQTSDW